MDEQTLTTKTQTVGSIIGTLVGIGLGFGLAAIFDINPAKEYGWFAGLFHGGWLPANWIMSWFSDSVLIKAPLHTTAYSVWWWFGVVSTVWGWILPLFSLFVNIRTLLKK